MATKKKKPSAAARNTEQHYKSVKKKKPIRREVGAVVCILLCLCTTLACFKEQAPGLNLLSLLFKGMIGSGIYVLPFSFLFSFIILLTHDGRPVALRVVCSFLMSLTIGALVHVFSGLETAQSGLSAVAELWQSGMNSACGGVLGGLLAMLLLLIGPVGAGAILIVGFVLELITTMNMTLGSIIRAIRERPRPEYEPPKKEHADTAKVIVDHIAERQIERRAKKASDYDLPIDEPPLLPPESKPETPKKTKAQKQKEDYEQSRERFDELLLKMEQPRKSQTGAEQMPPLVLDRPEQPPLVVESAPPIPEPEPIAPEPEKVKKADILKEEAAISQQIAEQEETAVYQYPPISLLHAGDGKSIDGTEEMRQNSERLDDTLASFNIEASIINVTRGPSVTRYELELSRGTKLSKITNLADDIALSLGASGVRIAAIPDKISVVGIEVPNRAVSTVLAREVIDSAEFSKSQSKISFAVGKDIGGNQIVGNIAKLPHLLIAGTTGSGKSVCMNSLIISLLYKAKPDEVKLIMVDPKMVELGVYNGIPHLLIPVVTDPKKAAGALQWSVTEMMRRYRMMADAGVNSMESYNKLAEKDEAYEKLPHLVVLIDELADLMLVAAKEVEESICRVAQMGRAAGVHLVIATQRPSADVITGLMKANIPSRIAFAVASAMESRIILDTTGAEKLVGKGDMLFAPLGQGKPKRVQGCFITEDEVQKVVDFVKKNDCAQYSDEVMQEIDRKAEQSGTRSGSNPASTESASDDVYDDEMTEAAIEVAFEVGQVSTSMLQRRLKLGYSRAARIVDEMEEKGIVGPYEGSKPRPVLISKEEWQAKAGTVPDDFDQTNPAVEDLIP